MQITKAQLTAQVAATDDSRPVLAGVYVDSEGKSISADGYALLVVPKDTVGARYVEQDAEERRPLGKPVILHAKDAARVAKMIPSGGEVFLNRGIDGKPMATVVGPGVGSTTTPVQEIEGNYPAYEKIVPDAAESVYEIAVDPEKLINLLKQMVAAAQERNPVRHKSVHAMHQVVLRFRGNEESIRIDAVDVAGLTGVLMPTFPKEGVMKKITVRAMKERTDLVQA